MKFGLRLVIILLGAVSALGMAEIGLRTFGGGLPDRSEWPIAETELKAKQFTNGDGWDVVFLGSSVTEAALDPRLLTGVAAYNGALPFSTPISHEVWYRGQFSDQKAEIVVLGLPAWPFHESNDEDLLASGIERALGEGTSSTPNLATVRHRGVFADWFELQTRAVSLQSQLWTPQGHLTAYYEISGARATGNFEEYGPPRMNEDVLASITRLAEHVKLQGGTFVLMIEPARFPGEVSEELVQRYLGTVRDLARSLEVELWDTSSVGWSDEFYADGLHFNRKGTEAFSALADELLEGVLGGSSTP